MKKYAPWLFAIGMIAVAAIGSVTFIAAKTEIQRHNFPDRFRAIQMAVKSEEANLNNLGAPAIAAQIGATLADWNALLSQIAAYTQADSVKAALPLGNQLIATGAVYDNIGETQDALEAQAQGILNRLELNRIALMQLKAIAQADVDSTKQRADDLYAKWLVETDPNERKSLEDAYDGAVGSQKSLEMTRNRIDYALTKLDACLTAVQNYLNQVKRLVNVIKISGNVYYDAGTAIVMVGLSNQDYMGPLPSLGSTADDLKNTWGTLTTLVDEFGKLQV